MWYGGGGVAYKDEARPPPPPWHNPCHLGVTKAERKQKGTTNLAVSRSPEGEESKQLRKPRCLRLPRGWVGRS